MSGKNILLILFLFCSFVFRAQTDFLYKNDYTTKPGERISVTDRATVKSFIEKDVYRIENSDPTQLWCFPDEVVINPSLDFEIEAKIKHISGTTEYGYGLIWGYRNGNNTFQFLISGNGYYKVYMTDSGKVKNITPWTPWISLKLGSETNVLKIRKVKDHLIFHINDAPVYRMNFKPFFGQNIGFAVGAGITLEVDYLYVRQQKEKIEIIPNSDQFGEAISLGPEVNSPYKEVMPVISHDGKTLLITRKDHPKNIGGSNDDIWVSKLKKDSTWSAPLNLGGPINNRHNNYAIALSQDNNTMVLGNVYLPNGNLEKGLSISYNTEFGWTQPKKVSIKNYYNRSDFNEACLSPDGKVLLLTLDRDDTKGMKDIYVSFMNTDSTWTEPKNIGGTVNTFADELSPFLAADGQTLYFSSGGHPGYGKSDIFMTRRLDDTWKNWSKPLNLGPKVNTDGWDAYFTVPAKGDYAYFSSARMGSKNSDIYRVKLPQSASPKPVVMLRGKVFNQKTKNPIAADVTVYEFGTEKEIAKVRSNASTGEYAVVLPKGKKFTFKASKTNFIEGTNNIDGTKGEGFKEEEVDLFITPLETGQTFVLNNLFFKANKYDILPESFPELDRLYGILKNSPALKIEIAGHTSKNAESEQFNIDLSTNRAKAVKDYLVKKGINGDRITTEGYGFNKPLHTQYDEVHQALNRRVEITILGK